MTRTDIETILSKVLPRATEACEPPTAASWDALAERLRTRLPGDFIAFTEARTAFEFPGDLYDVAENGRKDGNDTIVTVIESEAKDPAWPSWLVPFLGVGNGDYFALDGRAGEESPVMYWAHERKTPEFFCSSFGEWVRQLPDLLKGA